MAAGGSAKCKRLETDGVEAPRKERGGPQASGNGDDDDCTHWGNDFTGVGPARWHVDRHEVQGFFGFGSHRSSEVSAPSMLWIGMREREAAGDCFDDWVAAGVVGLDPHRHGT